MRNAWVVVPGIAIVGFAVAFLATRERSQPLTFTKSSSGQAPARSEPVKQPSGAPAKSPHDDSVVQDAAPQRDFYEELKNAEDRWQFAASVLAEAKRGNGSTQSSIGTSSTTWEFDEARRLRHRSLAESPLNT